MRRLDIDEEVRARLEAAFDKFIERAAILLARGWERRTEALEAVRNTVRAKLAAVGELSVAQGQDFKRYLHRDFRHLADEARRVRREAKHRLHPERLRDGALAKLAAVLLVAGKTLQTWSRKADDAIIYETGEISSAGTLTCLNCGRVIHLTKTSHVPPCPDCLAARFRKSY